jgi:long-chain fatty acid transport protein
MVRVLEFLPRCVIIRARAAVVAHTDSPSTIFFNPAQMNKLDGTQLELGTTFLIARREFNSATSGNTSETKDDVFFPSTFYITHKFNEKVSAGLGVFNPFGLGTDWGIPGKVDT